MKDSVSRLRIEPISKSHHRNTFQCGNKELTAYLRQFARQNDEKNIARTFVLADDDNRVHGYYSLSASSIAFQEIPRALRNRLPEYPIPAVLLARLAVDRSMQGNGLGERLLIDALARIVSVSTQTGVKVVLVDAIDDAAKAYYTKYGFMELADHERKLFLPVETISQLFK